MKNNTGVLMLTTLILLSSCGGQMEQEDAALQTLAHKTNKNNEMQVESKSNADTGNDLLNAGVDVLTVGGIRGKGPALELGTITGTVLLVPLATGLQLFALGGIIKAIGKETCTPSHPKFDADGLCYKRCKKGYNGKGPVCWENCSSGYKDDGATCRKPIKCNKNLNCTGGQVKKKKTHGRGAGIIPPGCGFFKDKFSCNKSSSNQCIWKGGKNGGKHCFTKYKNSPILCPKIVKKISKNRHIYLRQCHPVHFE